MNLKEITIYTDGACSGNPGKGGIGIILKHNEYIKEISVGYKLTTNNRMELLAVIVALQQLKFPSDVKIFSDSGYVVNAINKNWLTSWRNKNWYRTKSEKVKNIDLWEKFLEVSNGHKIQFIWVKGHDSNIMNNRADKLATSAINSSELLNDEQYEYNR